MLRDYAPANRPKRWRLSLERLGQCYRRPYCARHSSVSWNLMIGKNPLFVARQHGHSLVTMWRTYAAWMDGALESNIGLIRAAIEDSVPELAPSSAERDSTAQARLTLAERPSNTENRLPPDRAPVAEFGTRFVTRCGTVATQVPEEKEKESGGEGGIRITEKSRIAVPCHPLDSPDFAVDLAIAPSAAFSLRRSMPAQFAFHDGPVYRLLLAGLMTRGSLS